MLWVSWRQHRSALIGLLVVATVVAVAITLIASFALRTRIELGLDTCVPNFFGAGDPNNCNRLFTEWTVRVGIVRYLTYGLYVIPALVGSYLGGPLLARELERGTHRLAWTQGIGRVRWAATILGVVLATTAAAGVIIALGGHQSWPLLGLGTFRPFDLFDLEGPALVSYMVFGLALGAFIGAWRRRILTGMFFGLIAFALVRAVVMIDVRPYYEPPIAVPLAATFTFGQAAPIPADAWMFGSDAVDSQGRPVPQARVSQLIDEYSRVGCSAGRNCNSVAYLNERDVFQRQLYQPADRYWRFQLYEAGLYLALTAALVAVTLVMLRRRDA
jgi:hypothetical protein